MNTSTKGVVQGTSQFQTCDAVARDTGRREFPATARDETDGEGVYPDLKRRLSILRLLIFDSSVDAGTPRRPAAPNGPDTRPLLSMSAASMASISWVANVPVGWGAACGTSGFRPESHRASIDNVAESHTITARSMTFCSSRMLPGQSYDCSWANAPLQMPRIRFPARLVYRCAKYSTSRGMSARRSRRAGTSSGNTLSR